MSSLVYSDGGSARSCSDCNQYIPSDAGRFTDPPPEDPNTPTYRKAYCLLCGERKGEKQVHKDRETRLTCGSGGEYREPPGSVLMSGTYPELLMPGAHHAAPRPVVYVAGPMRGKQHFNFPAFDKARDELQAAGFYVLSPADHDREMGFDPWKLPGDFDWNTTPPGFDLGEALEWCAGAVRRCWAIYMLPDWNTSKGATWELDLANMLGKRIMHDNVRDVL